MNTTHIYRLVLLLLSIGLFASVASCGGAADQETIAALTPTPSVTPTPTPEPTLPEVPEPDEDEPTAVTDAEADQPCTAPGFGAELAVAELGDRQFRIDLVLDGMGLPVGRFWVLEAGERRHLAGFPERPQGPPPAAEVVTLTSGSVGASVTVEVPPGEELTVVAHVHGEVRGADEYDGRCQEFWYFTTAETEPVPVG